MYLFLISVPKWNFSDGMKPLYHSSFKYLIAFLDPEANFILYIERSQQRQEPSNFIRDD